MARPIGQFDGNADYHYQTLRCNCDLLKIIQLGLSFTDAEGKPCPECCTWQFNFKFSLSCVVCSADRALHQQQLTRNCSRIDLTCMRKTLLTCWCGLELTSKHTKLVVSTLPRLENYLCKWPWTIFWAFVLMVLGWAQDVWSCAVR